MLVMIMMGVGMMGEWITFDGYAGFYEVVGVRRFMSEDFGRWKWNHDTLAAAIYTEEVYKIRERSRIQGDPFMSATKFTCLACLV